MALRSVFGPWPPRSPSSSLPSRLLPPSMPASTANLRLPNSTLSSISDLSHVPSSSGTLPFLRGDKKINHPYYVTCLLYSIQISKFWKHHIAIQSVNILAVYYPPYLLPWKKLVLKMYFSFTHYTWPYPSTYHLHGKMTLDFTNILMNYR